MISLSSKDWGVKELGQRFIAFYYWWVVYIYRFTGSSFLTLTAARSTYIGLQAVHS